MPINWENIQNTRKKLKKQIVFKIDLTLFNNHILYSNWVFYTISISSSFSKSYTSLFNVGHLRTFITDLATWPLSFGVSLNSFFDPPTYFAYWICTLSVTPIITASNFLTIWVFEELVANLCGTITNIPYFNSKVEFWGILFWLSVLSWILIISSQYAWSLTVPLVLLKKCALKIPGSDWALSKSSLCSSLRFDFLFQLLVGTWKTLTLLLLLTALKNETESVIIDFPVTTHLPAKRLIVPLIPSTVPLPWLAAKDF